MFHADQDCEHLRDGLAPDGTTWRLDLAGVRLPAESPPPLPAEPAGEPVPGHAVPALRRQLKVLSDFLHSLDLARLHPDPLLVLRAPGVVTHALSQPGKAHAIYVQGRSPTTLTLNLAEGSWTAEWISVEDGRVLRRETVVAKTGEPSALASPGFSDAVAVRILLDGRTPVRKTTD